MPRTIRPWFAVMTGMSAPQRDQVILIQGICEARRELPENGLLRHGRKREGLRTFDGLTRDVDLDPGSWEARNVEEHLGAGGAPRCIQQVREPFRLWGVSYYGQGGMTPRGRPGFVEDSVQVSQS